MPVADEPVAAIFDLDGLLIDSEHAWHVVEIELFGRLGVPLDCERCQETKGGFVLDAVRHWHERFPWDEPAPEVVAIQIIEEMAAVYGRGDITLKPGARHALGFCRSLGLSMAVASSSPQQLIDAALRGHDLLGYFAALCSAESEVAGKPNPAVFLRAAGRLGVDPGHCVVFEDAPAGVEAALRAGMACIAVPEPTGVPDPRLQGADLVLGSLEELDLSNWNAVTRAMLGRSRLRQQAGAPAARMVAGTAARPSSGS